MQFTIALRGEPYCFSVLLRDRNSQTVMGTAAGPIAMEGVVSNWSNVCCLCPSQQFKSVYISICPLPPSCLSISCVPWLKLSLPSVSSCSLAALSSRACLVSVTLIYTHANCESSFYVLGCPLLWPLGPTHGTYTKNIHSHSHWCFW